MDTFHGIITTLRNFLPLKSSDVKTLRSAGASQPAGFLDIFIYKVVRSTLDRLLRENILIVEVRPDAI